MTATTTITRIDTVAKIKVVHGHLVLGLTRTTFPSLRCPCIEDRSTVGISRKITPQVVKEG